MSAEALAGAKAKLADLDGRLEEAIRQKLSKASSSTLPAVEYEYDDEACEARVIPFPHAAPSVAPKVTITPDEFLQSLVRIVEAIKEGRIDPVTFTWLDVDDTAAAPAVIIPTPMLNAKGLEAFDAMRTFMLRDFPPLWPVMEACLCACATMLLAHRPSPVTLILVGPSGSGKGTVLEMLTQSDSQMLVPVDDLTTASFMSQAEKTKGEPVLKVIQHKILVTSDMGSVLRGRDDKVAEKHFARLARVLDGLGLSTAGGYHGIQGLRGDYLFTWLGATTPLTDVDYRAMSAIGQRLLFIRMPYDGKGDLSSDEVRGASSYNRKTLVGRRIASEIFKEVLPDTTVIRSLNWHEDGDAPAILDVVREYINLLSITRTEHGHEREKGLRAYLTVLDLMRARALWHGRSQVSADDLTLARALVLGSMRPMWLTLLRALTVAGADGLTVEDVSRHTALSPYKSRQLMDNAVQYGLVESFETVRTITMNGHTQRLKPAGAIRITSRWSQTMQSI